MEALEQMLRDMAVTPPRADCDKALAGATSPEEAHKVLNDKCVSQTCELFPRHTCCCATAPQLDPQGAFC